MLYHPVTITSGQAHLRRDGLYLEGNLFLAPVAGYSDRAFRSVCVENGANLTFTEMVSAEALVRGSEKTELLLARAANETRYGVQIFGSDPKTMAAAACIVADRVSPELIDINAGCPIPKIVKTGAGAALTRDPERLHAVVRAAAEAVFPLPVTVKIRSGWDSGQLSWREAALAAAEGGAAAITLHPRTRSQGYEGSSDWSLLRELKKLLNGGIPVFGSGDLFSPEAAREMLESTGCDGVMFARGAMGNPFIFGQTKKLLETGTYEPVSPPERIRAGLRELELLAADRGEDAACREMRKRFCACTKGFPGGAELRAEIVKTATIDNYYALFADILNNSDCQKP
ncbi:MAG: tRNA dihydrouridine synthase DusB [Spirochaetaceae bacterium]|jgi:nifR3 family TIM-barrel protein|nr:tRNA dihydrouridine synthase DusB [Spirochaetaceae bacterium]